MLYADVPYDYFRADGNLVFAAGACPLDGRELKAIRITIAESPTAQAWYEAPLW